MFKRIVNNKSFKYLIAIIYIYTFYSGYILFLNGFFNYMGFTIIDGRENDLLLKIFSFLIALFPLIFYRGIVRISSFLCIFIYLFSFVPITISYFFILPDTFDIVTQQLIFAFSMSVLFLADRFYFKNMIVLPSAFNLIKVVFYITLLSTFILIAAYGSNLKLVSFEDVYDLRSKNSDIGSGGFIGYLTIWLSNAFAPFVLSYSLFSKKKNYFLVGTFACIVIYMATGAKSVLLFPAMIFLLHLLLRKVQLKNSFVFIGGGLITILIISLQFDFNITSAILWMRTVGIGGLLTNKYYEFFADHPFTYYSHINVVNAITHTYPYGDLSVGQVVGNQYFSEGTNANANFWANDGYAALGTPGIFVSTFILFFIFIIFNSISRHYKLLFIILLLIPYINSLLNTSLFSSLVSGGGLIIFLILSFDKTMKNNFINIKN